MNPLALIPKNLVLGTIIVLLLSGGFTWFGYDWASGKYKKQLADYQTKVTTLHTRLDQLDGSSGTQTIIKYKTKLVHIKDVGDHNANVAKTIVPSTCNVSSGWVSTHDAAATGNKVDSIAGANGTDSGIKDTEALATVSENYTTFLNQKEKLDRLQEEIIQHNANIDKANAEAAKEKALVEQMTSTDYITTKVIDLDKQVSLLSKDQDVQSKAFLRMENHMDRMQTLTESMHRMISINSERIEHNSKTFNTHVEQSDQQRIEMSNDIKHLSEEMKNMEDRLSVKIDKIQEQMDDKEKKENQLSTKFRDAIDKWKWIIIGFSFIIGSIAGSHIADAITSIVKMFV